VSFSLLGVSLGDTPKQSLNWAYTFPVPARRSGAAEHDGSFNFNLINGANVKIVEAAQRDLCPDTIH
jgi:hypothetical protein